MQPSLAREQPESRLSAFCAGLMEAVWLAAVCVVPLLLNPQSPLAGYQPFKYGFLRMLALLGAAAWAVRAVERRSSLQPGLATLLRSPLSILLLVFALAVSVSTAFSVYPALSFFGAYETFQGALTYGAELVLLALVACNLRTRDQIERFVTVVLVTSLAISVCAILQRFGWDPRHPDVQGKRVFSTAGHPIYLAGYLLMCLPLTIYRLVALYRWPQTGRVRRIAIGFYGAILATQLVAFVFAESRGPILALSVTLFAFGVLYAAYQRWKRTLLIACTVVIVAAAALALPGSVMKNLAVVPGLKRFALTTPLQKGVEFFRADIWKQAPSIIFAAKPLPHPTGGVERWHNLRPWIGYGPETLDCVLPIHYTVPNNLENIIENRFHNLLWDLWFSLGIVGLVSFLAFIVLLFYTSYRRLGFITSRPSVLVFWVAAPLFALAGVLLFVALFGIGFAGVGLLGGLIVGLLLSACASILRPPNEERRQLSNTAILLLALLSAIAGHLIDTAFAFASAPTAVLFWTYAGLIIAVLRGAADQFGESDEPGYAKRKSDKRERSTQRSTSGNLVPAALVTLGLLTLSYSFIHHYSYMAISTTEVLRFSLLRLDGPEAYSLLLIVIFTSWLAASFAFALDRDVAAGSKNIGRPLMSILLIAGVAGLVYVLLRAGQIAAIDPIPDSSAPVTSGLKQARAYDRLFTSGIAVLFVVVLAIALGLARRSRISAPLATASGRFAGIFALVVTIVSAWVIAITPLRAAVGAAWGKALDITGHVRLSPAVYRHALALNPRPTNYSLMLGDALINEAQKMRDWAQRKNNFAEAERVLLKARELSDLNRTSFNLGRLYLIWSDHEDQPKKAELVRKAAETLRQARAFEPHNEPVTRLSDVAEKAFAEQAGDRAP